MILQCDTKAVFLHWFKHILFMTEHDKGLGRATKLFSPLYFSIPIFLHCCLDCQSCLTHLNSTGWATWVLGSGFVLFNDTWSQ